MSQFDRISRALFVAAAVGLGWGIRGTFGHLIGASYPGACLALALAYVSGQDALRRWMPILAATTGLGISLGGYMSYGLIHGYAQSDTFVNYSYGLFTLFLEGGAWGVFGCAGMGLLLEKQRPTWIEVLAGVITMIVCGVALQFVVVHVFKFRVNPERSDDLIAFTGASVALFVYLNFIKKRLALYTAALGYLGFGLGMCGGRVLGNISNVLQTNSAAPFTISHWNVMELSVGLIGGFIVAYGMLGYDYPDPPDKHFLYKPLSILSMIYVVFGIPFLHRITRLSGDRITSLTKAFTNLQYESPQSKVTALQSQLTFLCVIALAGAIAWIVLYIRYEQRWSWFPVLWLSGVMLLFQNIFALYFVTPHQPGNLDTQTFYWVLLLLMIGYVIVQSLDNGPEDNAEGIDEKTDFKTWITPIAGIVSFLICLGITSLVNGDQTMKTATTRWPIWEWNQGPFPGRDAPPK